MDPAMSLGDQETFQKIKVKLRRKYAHATEEYINSIGTDILQKIRELRILLRRLNSNCYRMTGEEISEMDGRIKELQNWIENALLNSNQDQPEMGTKENGPDDGDPSKTKRFKCDETDVDVNNVNSSKLDNESAPIPVIAPVNPLMIDLVLHNVMQCVDYKTLKSARQVCKKWDQVLLPLYSRKSLLYVDFKQKDCSAQSFDEVFTPGFESLRIFKSIQFRVPIQLDNRIMNNWMGLNGRHLEHLKLTQDPPKSPQDLDFFRDASKRKNLFVIKPTTLESILCDWCPNLKTLEIPVPQFSMKLSAPTLDTNKPKVVCLESFSIGCIVSKHFSPEVEKVTEQVFKFCKEIYSLEVKKDTYRTEIIFPRPDDLGGNRVQQEEMPENIFRNELPTFLSLKSLDLGQYIIQNGLLTKLCSMEMINLTSVRVGNLINNAPSFLKAFLSKYGPQLINLELDSLEGVRLTHCRGRTWILANNGNGIPVITLASLGLCDEPTRPIFKCLKSLSVNTTSWQIGTLDFLLDIPNLTNLTLTGRQSCIIMLRNMFGAKKPLTLLRKKMPTLLQLKIGFEINKQIVETVAECFPNLQKLSIFLPENLCAAECLEVIQELSVLSMLTSLELNIPYSAPETEEGESVGWLADISTFAEFRTLKHLQIIAGEPVGFKSKDLVDHMMILGTVSDMRIFVDELQKAPALRTVHFKRFKIFSDAYTVLLRSKEKFLLRFSDCRLITILN